MKFFNCFNTCSKHNYTGTSVCPDCEIEIKNVIKFKNEEVDLMLDGLYFLQIEYIGNKKLKKELKKINDLIEKITMYGLK